MSEQSSNQQPRNHRGTVGGGTLATGVAVQHAVMSIKKDGSTRARTGGLLCVRQMR